MVKLIEPEVKVIEPAYISLDEKLKKELIKLFNCEVDDNKKIVFLTNSLGLEGEYTNDGYFISRLPQDHKNRKIKGSSISIQRRRKPLPLWKRTEFTFGDFEYDDLLILGGHYKIINGKGEEISEIISGPNRSLLELVTNIITPIGVKINKERLKEKAFKKIRNEKLTLEDPYKIAKKDKTPVDLILNQYLMIHYSEYDFKLNLILEPILSYHKLFSHFFIREKFSKEYEKCREYMQKINDIGNSKDKITVFNNAPSIINN